MKNTMKLSILFAVLTLVISAGSLFAAVTLDTPDVISSTEIDLDWTYTNGDGVVLFRNTDGVFLQPTNDIAYPAGTPLGSAISIYNGSGTSHSDTGLTPNTLYYYSIWNYGPWGITIRYTGSPDTGQGTTLPEPGLFGIIGLALLFLRRK